MSHTTVVKTVPIKSVVALRMAVEELQRSGVKCELLEGATPRMYYPNQFERDTGKQFADYTLKMPGKYDIGFSYNEETKQYDMYYDNWASQISQYLGVEVKKGEDVRAAEVGKFSQAYTKNASIHTMVTEQGFTLSGTTVNADGSISLVFDDPVNYQFA